MNRISFEELCDIMFKFNDEHNCTQFDKKHILRAVIVFTEDSFTAPYSEKERSYAVINGNKYFMSYQGGNSLFGDCLDGVDTGVRLDWYMSSECENPWKVDYCYLIEE